NDRDPSTLTPNEAPSRPDAPALTLIPRQWTGHAVKPFVPRKPGKIHELEKMTIGTRIDQRNLRGRISYTATFPPRRNPSETRTQRVREESCCRSAEISKRPRGSHFALASKVSMR